jgi:hypothetical protein
MRMSILALALIGGVAGLAFDAAPAAAQSEGWQGPAHGDSWRGDRRRHHRHWRPYHYRAPAVVYYPPPPVYYPPPPVYYAPRPRFGIWFNG